MYTAHSAALICVYMRLKTILIEVGTIGTPCYVNTITTRCYVYQKSLMFVGDNGLTKRWRHCAVTYLCLERCWLWMARQPRCQTSASLGPLMPTVADPRCRRLPTKRSQTIFTMNKKSQDMFWSAVYSCILYNCNIQFWVHALKKAFLDFGALHK